MMSERITVKRVVNESIRDLDCEKVLTIDEAGHFNLKLSRSDKQVGVWYGWDMNSGTFSPSGTVDVLLNDLKRKKTYRTYITEFEVGMLPSVLTEIAALAEMYFNGEFEIVDGKHEYLRFNNKDIRYSEYSLAKQYVTL